MKRTNPFLFERDGDFNPGWLLMVLFCTVGAIGAIISFLEAVFHPAHDVLTIALGFSFVIVGMLLIAIIVVPLAKAKLLSPVLDHAVHEIAPRGPGLPARPSGGEVLSGEQLMPPVAHGRADG